MKSILLTIKRLYHGQTMLRILMNERFREFVLRGKVLDVGGARNPDYFKYCKKEGDVSVVIVDGALSSIDFEKDPLPYSTGTIQTVISANVLEHIYNYRFLVNEMYRVLSSGGTLYGFVPFLINYHPDPHDYFRYTKESLRRIFSESGFVDIEIREVGGGPFIANYNNIVLSVPRPIRIMLFLCFFLVDYAFLSLRPQARERYPLGYSFVAHKK